MQKKEAIIFISLFYFLICLINISHAELSVGFSEDLTPGVLIVPKGILLNQLLDVNVPSPNDGESLVWNEATGMWIANIVSGNETSYNHTLDTYNLWNNVWLDTYNETYNELILDNASLYSTYNATYDIWAYNMTAASNYDYNHTLDVYNLWNNDWLDTFNATYNELILDNASLYSTYNATYDIWAYNMSILNNYDYNHTLDTYNLWNNVWLDTYNETYNELILDNASLYSTYNESYVGLINNASYLDTFNATYNELILDNASLYSTYNETYNQWAYNMTIPSNYDYNHTLDVYNLWNSVWLDTFNATYNELILDNASLYSTYNESYVGLINNASYLDTFNATYNELILDNASLYSTYNATYDALSSTQGISFFINYTLTTTTGNITSGGLNGYSAGNSICQAEVHSLSHMCSMDELINTFSYNKSNVNFTATFRASEGAPGYLAEANDCDGWTSATGSALGSIWVGSITHTNGYGSGSLVACSTSRAIGCCI